jgi:hypothetical protein
MNIIVHSRNAVEVVTDTTEVFLYPARFLRTGPSNVPAIPPFWNHCLIGRIYHDCWLLRHSPLNQEVRTIITGPTPTGTFEKLELKAGQRAFVDLAKFAGCIVSSDRLNPNKPSVLHPIISGLFRPTTWAMGHPIPAVFEGPATILFHGAALRWDRTSAGGEYRPSQIVSFDADRGFGVMAMQPGSTVLSLIYNALSFESRFVSDGEKLLVEDYIEPSNILLHALRHFLSHVVFFALLGLVFFLNR